MLTFANFRNWAEISRLSYQIINQLLNAIDRSLPPQMSLPDELWRWILELGVETTCLNYKDLCCLSMTCRRLNRLSKEGVLWSKLLTFDFPTQPSSSTNYPPPKTLYQIKFDKDKVKRLLAEKRAVLRVESQVHEHKRKLHEIEGKLVQENDKIKSAIVELKNLLKVREASTALKVWQPAIIHSRQKQIVEHCSVPVASRINALEMEIKLCKQQISGFLKAKKDETTRLEATKERLSRIKYRPLQSLEGGSKSIVVDESIKEKKFSKKLNRVK
uniref:F-box protein SKIP24 n=1 Tax=Erigeron canadensis TaxID=72917 RepID=UPI001CB89649|nr:F-box protein SKIP24 [Erigeron canadensis]